MVGERRKVVVTGAGGHAGVVVELLTQTGREVRRRARAHRRIRVGAPARVGLGAAVIERVAIDTDARVAAGAAVGRAVPAVALVVGVPARPLEGLRGRRAEGRLR